MWVGGGGVSLEGGMGEGGGGGGIGLVREGESKRRVRVDAASEGVCGRVCGLREVGRPEGASALLT